MTGRVPHYIRQHSLVKAGDRVGIAVSGGADSVALLRILHALRQKLGIIVSVLHFNHKIRGEESDADEAFVRELALQLGLPFSVDSGDAPGFARQHSLSLETAARELRHAFFKRHIESGAVDQIATAHTMDDQAESALMRLIRGAGTRGLAGIYPKQSEASLVRPLLEARRTEIEAYLRSLGQPWREDASNQDTKHTRNRVRHELLPLLREYNPGIVETLSRTAEVARGEEEYWSREVERLLPFIALPGKPVRGGGRANTGEENTMSISIEALGKQPIAMQRRLMRAVADRLGIQMDLKHVEDGLTLSAAGKSCELPGGWRLRRSFRELQFEFAGADSPEGYEYFLSLPGEVAVPQIGAEIEAQLLPWVETGARDNLEVTYHIQDTDQLTVRNWRPGDRFRPAFSGSEKKVKEILQHLKVAQPERQNWPVVAAGDQVVWVKGTRAPRIRFERAGHGSELRIAAKNLGGEADQHR